MVNGNLETWQVMKWLKKHPKHKGEAPETDRMRAQRVKTALRGEVVFGFLSRARGWAVDSFPSHRSDWTIYNERDEPVEFKKKRRAVKTGLVVHTGDVIEVIMRGGAGCGSDVAPISGEILIREKG